MFAAVPALIAEAAAWVGAIVVITGGLTAIFTRKPFRWLGRRLVTEPLGGWLRHQINTSDTGHLVAYHLGPNDGTPPVHTRIARLEVLSLLRPEDHTHIDLEED